MVEYMTPENIGKIVALLISIVTLFATLKKFISKKENLKIDYEFAEKFIADDKWEKIHDYLLELGYLALSGKQLEASVIRYFLSQKDPSKKLSDYTRGSKYLTAIKTNNKITKIALITPLNDKQKFKWAVWRSFAHYFFTAFLGLLPLIFFSKLQSYNISFVILLLIWVSSFIMLAISSLVKLSALESAKRVTQLESNKQKETN